MQLNKILSVTALILGCVACEFDEYRVKAVKQRLREPDKGVCTLTTDQSCVIASCLYDENGAFTPRLRSFDAVTGQLIAVSPFEVKGTWAVRGVAPDRKDMAEFWTLHANGYRLKWTENFMLVDAELPIPNNLVPGLTGRIYYDIDIAFDGTVLMTVEDFVAGAAQRTYLYRQAPGQLWERGTALDVNGASLMSKECRVSHDNASGLTLVLESDTSQVIRFEGVNAVGMIDLPDASGVGQHGYTDIAAFGRMMTVSTRDLGANGQGKIFEIDAVTGEVMDEMTIGQPMALAIKAPLLHGQPGEVSVFVTGLDYFPGKYGLMEVTLK